jgi:DNA-directed RNA polymerase subunit alpha
MSNITLPTKPEQISNDGFKAQFAIENLYPGYGHTFGNSLRRIILSSIPGVAVTTVQIDGVDHEYSAIEGVKEDVVTILMNLKRVVFRLEGSDEIECTLKVNGDKTYTAQDIEASSEVEIVTPDTPILTVNDKKASFNITFTIKKGIGYVAKEDIYEGKLPVGLLVMDTSFTPIRRVTYEVENMRVGDRTDFNKIIMYIETDGTLTPQEVLDQSLGIMHEQIQAMTGE